MSTWPNWVDLIILIIMFRTCYIAFSRGFWTELLNVLGLIGVTIFVINYASVVINWLLPWIGWIPPLVSACILFWAMFAGAIVLMHVALRALTKVFKWERLHWFIQTIAVLSGAVRGLWWVSVVLLGMVYSRVPYFVNSVEERSLMGPYVVALSEEIIEKLSNQFPGATYRQEPFFPPLVQHAPDS